MRLILFLCLLILTYSCGVKKSSSYEMGKTTRAEVIAEKGQPIHEVTNPIPNSTTMKFKDDENFQLKGDTVVNRFANPEMEERSLLWWKHKFKDCQTRTTKIQQPLDAHTPPEIEFACPEEGTAVIYSQGSDFVTRVVQFEK